MIYLVLSVLVASSLLVIFKLFEKYKVNNVHAIVINYVVAFICGLLSAPVVMSPIEISKQSWFFGALGLGMLFIFIFNIMAITTQKSGLSVASVATRMSVVIPITFGFIFYNESFGVVKILGILLALVAVFLASVKSKDGFKVRNLFFPFLLFLGSGTIDSSLKFIENFYVKEENIAIFSASLFGFAGIFGILFLVIKRNLRIRWKSILAGICLGIPNYYSVVFIMKALATEGMDSSTVFTINNVGVVALSTLLGLLLFKERLLRKNWIGILLAILSIFLVVY
ncbi:MAG: EamA family transporter [Flavobacteriales bacterium]|nr:EamA family transporter [Flavobacteriales bacterium]